MKYIITESQYDNAIDKFITYYLKPHEVKESKRYPISTFWVKDGKVIAEIIKKRGYIWIDYEIWSTISRMFSLTIHETKKVIRDWLDEHYNLEGLTPICGNVEKSDDWKNIILY